MAKREREVEDEQQQHKTHDLVSCLMLLSKADQNKSALIRKRSDSSGRVFICKTCDREFTSFQALGGHRASHKKPKQMMPAAHSEPLRQLAAQPSSVPVKPRAHECPICGVEFAIGQALGGHMRRHRDVRSAAEDRIRPAAVPVLKKSNTSKRVSMSCVELDLDLNLAPPGYDLIS